MSASAETEEAGPEISLTTDGDGMDAIVAPRRRIPDWLDRPFDIRSLALTGLFILALFYTLYFARSVLLPVVLALLLSFLLAPIVRALTKFRIRHRSAPPSFFWGLSPSSDTAFHFSRAQSPVGWKKRHMACINCKPNCCR